MVGALNLRDLGGICASKKKLVRKGVLFRSDGLSRLTENDLKLFEKLKINSVIDLRHAEEIAKAPDKLPQNMSINQFTCGFYAEGTKELFQSVNSGLTNANESRALMREVYAKMPIAHTKEIQQIIKHVLNQSSLPCLIHCMSGKDRTGLVIAIILKAIGVPMNIIMEDYEMSNGDYQQVDVFGPKALPESVSVVMAADATYLEASFNAIKEVYTTFDNYLATGLVLYQTDIEKLKSFNKPFFLLVEGSQIDWGGHDNDSEHMISEMLEFDRTVEKVFNFANIDKNTTVVITADHETGGVAIIDGNIEDSKVVNKYVSKDHTATMVPIFSFGPYSSLFSGVYDNTEIFDKLEAIIKK